MQKQLDSLFEGTKCVIFSYCLDMQSKWQEEHTERTRQLDEREHKMR